MNKNKKIILAIFSLSSILLLSIIIFLSRDIESDYFLNDIYYIDILENTLEPVKVKVNESSKEEEIKEIYKRMLKPLDSIKQRSAILNDDKYLLDGFEISDEVLFIYVSDEIDKLSTVDKMYFEGSIVWTFTGLPYIKEIAFTTLETKKQDSDMDIIYYSDRNKVKINPIISPDKIVAREITLYFANIYTKELQTENRSISYNSDKLIASYIVEQTLAGPLENTHISYIPKATQINGVRIEEKICYVDLSGDFIDKNLLIYEQWLSVYSIVYALTALEEIDSVQFLIDSTKYGMYGNVDITNPLQPLN